MGRVFRALDLELDEEVALKVLHGAAGVLSSASREQLRREVKATRRVVSPHVVRTYGHGIAAGGHTGHGGRAGAGGATLSTGCAAACDDGGWCDPVFGWCVYEWARWRVPSWKGSGLPNEPTYTVKNGTVADSVTGLVWQRAVDDAACQGGPTCRWYDAHAYCRDLRLDGGGWRLPSVIELLTIVDYGAVNASMVLIDEAAFPGTPRETFWSSTCVPGPCSVTSPAEEVAASFVDFYGGLVADTGSASAHRVRCVR